MSKIKDILIKYKKILKDACFDTYALDVEVLLMEVTGFDKTFIYINLDYELSKEQYEKFVHYINRRLKNEPIAYIINKCEFMGMDFELNKDTLIPRPDTEILVEKCIEIINQNNIKTVLDIGTGSGAIAISIAKYCKDVNVLAVDINKNALDMANKNANLNNVSNISFLQSDLFDKVVDNFDMIVSNPPYIKTEDISTLDTNVKDFEPILALDGGEDGLDFYKKIVQKSKEYLNNQGYLMFEIGYNQANDVKSLMENDFYNIHVLKDLAGLDRVVFGKIK